MSASVPKVYIQIESEAEQQEHLKQQRKTLKPLQDNTNSVNEKENLKGGASIVDQLSRLKANVSAVPKYGKRKCMETAIALQDAGTQTEARPAVNNADKPITVDDLTSESEPGENYYKKLAESRREVLEEALSENKYLHERVEGLEDELESMRKELDETKNLIDVLKQIVDETKEEDDEEEEGGEEEQTNEEHIDDFEQDQEE